MSASSGELLLSWLSHMGEGSWAGFVRAHSQLQSSADEGSAYARMRLRATLSELAHAEFFIGGGTRWRVFQPAIGLLPKAIGALIGGRTPRLLDQVRRSAERCRCGVDVQHDDWGPDRVRLDGSEEAIERTAQDAGVRYIPNLPLALAAEVTPVAALLESAAPAAAPRNWSVRSFDLNSLTWVDELLPRTAYEYRSRHGPRRHFVRIARARLFETERRQAVYLAAHLNRVRLIGYDEEAQILTVPGKAPLPDALARAAAACSATSAREGGGMLTYSCVSPAVAGVVMAAAGQPPPEPHWLPDDRSRR